MTPRFCPRRAPPRWRKPALKAETFAKAAGVSLGAILSISEENAQGPRPMYAMAAPMAMAKAVPVAMGEQSVTADVTIVWEIK